MLAQRTDRSELLRQHIHRAVQPHRQHVIVLVQRTEHGAHLHIRAETADAGLDFFLGFRMQPDLARQGQQADRLLQRYRVAIEALGQRGAARLHLLVLAGLALLHIQAIGSAPDTDLLAGFRLAQHAHPLLQRVAALLAIIHGKPAGELAGRVVRAADEAAVTAQLQPQPAGAAGGADTRVGAALPCREEMFAEVLVQRVDHIGDLQLLGILDRLGEIFPEIAHHLAPVGGAAGDIVELLLQPGGEAGIDIALEEAGQERGHQPAAVFRNEALLVQPDIVPVLQHAQDRGIGRGAANAEFLHLLHQAGFGVARRRLGEML